MIKVIEVYGRKEGFSRKEFLDYQKGPHMKAAGKAPEFAGRIRGSFQNTMILPEDLPVVEGLYKSADAKGKDSVVEIFFDNCEAALAAFQEPNYLKYVRPDEEYFSDANHGWSVMSREEILYEKADVSGYKKYFIFFNTDDEALECWDHKKTEFIELAKEVGSIKIAENSREELQLENAGNYQKVIELWLENDAQIETLVTSKKLEAYLETACGINNESIITLCANENYVVPEE